MSLEAPEPTGRTFKTEDADPQVFENKSAVNVSIIGCGGCGINLARPFLDNPEFGEHLKHVLYFDTSSTNTRYGEKVNIITNGSGSGSNRAENALEIERKIPLLT